jgi:hypothetical protein
LLYIDVKKNSDDNSLNPKMSEEEKAKVVIQKAKVEDDEYKNYTEEQTYYRFVSMEKNNLTLCEIPGSHSGEYEDDCLLG